MNLRVVLKFTDSSFIYPQIPFAYRGTRREEVFTEPREGEAKSWMLHHFNRAGAEENHVTNSSASPANPTLQDWPWIWTAKSLNSTQTLENCFPEKNPALLRHTQSAVPSSGSSGQQGHRDAGAGTAEGKSSHKDEGSEERLKELGMFSPRKRQQRGPHQCA